MATALLQCVEAFDDSLKFSIMTDEELKSLFEAMRQENAAAHADTRAEIAAVRIDNAAAHAETRVNLRAYTDEKISELRRHFDVLTEAVRHEVQLVAEGYQALDNKLEREVHRLEDKMGHGFADTQAMIRISHGTLDRRLRKVEGR